MRRFAVLGALAALILPASAWGAEGVTLTAEPAVVSYDGIVRLHGSAGLLADVFLVQRLPSGWTVVAQATANTDGAFAFELRARKPGVYQARTIGGQSAEVSTGLRPLLRARLSGSTVTGRLLPARAGTVVLRSKGRTRRIRVGSGGSARGWATSEPAGMCCGSRSSPQPGYVRVVARRLALRIRQPALRLGSHGPGVLALKRRLAALGYALPSVNSGYRYETYEAVLAFQKVHGLPRTGRVDSRFWQVLGQASTPRPRVPRGDYIEVSKSRQTLL